MCKNFTHLSVCTIRTNIHPYPLCSHAIDIKEPDKDGKKDPFVGVNLSYTQNIELFLFFSFISCLLMLMLLRKKQPTNDLLLNKEMMVDIQKLQSNEMKARAICNAEIFRYMIQIHFQCLRFCRVALCRTNKME